MLPYKYIKKIKTLQKALGMNEQTYRDALSAFGVESCKDLTIPDAKELINDLEEKAVSMGVWQPKRKKPYDELAGREGDFATPAQLRMIAAMWQEVSYIEDPIARSKALDQFVKRITGIDLLIWIKHEHVQKLISALKAMKKQQNIKKERKQNGS